MKLVCFLDPFLHYSIYTSLLFVIHEHNVNSVNITGVARIFQQGGGTRKEGRVGRFLKMNFFCTLKCNCRVGYVYWFSLTFFFYSPINGGGGGGMAPLCPLSYASGQHCAWPILYMHLIKKLQKSDASLLFFDEVKLWKIHACIARWFQVYKHDTLTEYVPNFMGELVWNWL